MSSFDIGLNKKLRGAYVRGVNTQNINKLKVCAQVMEAQNKRNNSQPRQSVFLYTLHLVLVAFL
jgi:hypothetical protein